MSSSKTSLSITVMTTIMICASLVPVQIHAEEEISEEPEVIEETVLEEEISEEEWADVADEEIEPEDDTEEENLGVNGPVFYCDENGTQYQCDDYQLLSSAVDQPGVTLANG